MRNLRSDPRFVRHTGIAAPFLQREIEGEMIAPVGVDLHDLHAAHADPAGVSLAVHSHDGPQAGHHVSHAFHGFRYRPDGSENPAFILNQAPYRSASILLAGASFGQGSLQGFAVIRLMQCGMRVIIAPSFGPVFYDDCFAYGLLPVTLDESFVSRLAAEVTRRPEVPTTVDLEREIVEHPAVGSIPFRVDARRRMSLLLGSDTLDERLQHADSAAALRNLDRQARPWLYETRGPGDP
jgi:3-isopropylmalate/(R)-2-methylmalate dehydratase small subunit